MGEAISGKNGDEPTFRIGAVCRLTGLSQHVLRVWEKRYDAVEPLRSETDRRLYRQQDIDRLTLLKTLVDRGQAIGSIAGLDDEELQRRLKQTVGSLQRTTPAEKPRLLLIGESFVPFIEDIADSEVFSLAERYASLAELNQATTPSQHDVAVIEWPSLQPEMAIEISRLVNQLNVRHVILVYDFASRAALKRLPGERVTALRSPLDLAAIEAVVGWRLGAAVLDDNGLDEIALNSTRLFSNRQLAFLAQQSSAIDCECPMHLSQLITKLVHFEIYSAECESRNADDAALHNHLFKTTSRARNLMEHALMRVVEAENLDVPKD